MWLIDLVHTICTSHGVYFYTVTHFGDEETLSTRFPLSIPLALLCHGIITMLVQSYFAYRIARFADNNHPYIIPAICTILMFCSLVSDVAVVATETASLYTGKSSIATYFGKMEWLIIIPLVLRNVVDVIISGTMVYYLRKQRSMSAYKNTIAVVDKLILWAIGGYLIRRTSRIHTRDHALNSFSDGPLQFVDAWMTLITVIPKIFSNAMLANMNSRIGLRQLQSTVVIGSEFGIHIANTDDAAVTRSMHFNEMQSTTTSDSNATHSRKSTTLPH
ncbi:hypothetical protein D9757_008814 [Collybiopsis confluens]|uniref:DUF6534 domain-containing protein n=1 Tax=Collybiopsis confluens TaxID=2823264 RepID=A0A8H5H301_9AGAR|nr:hypothetical protein D9757_008814 [Collybiopsis confluens]